MLAWCLGSAVPCTQHVWAEMVLLSPCWRCPPAAFPHMPALQVSGMGAGQLAPGQERVPGLTWRAVGSVEDVLAVLAGRH